MMEWILVVHGGAGRYRKLKDHPEARNDYLLGIESALREGSRILQEGGSAVDAVCRAIEVLEAHPLFNAGKGSAWNEEGFVEMDAAIMDGKYLACGAVGAVRRFLHPIRIARKVMERTPHVLLVGEQADWFAVQHGESPVSFRELAVSHRAEEWLRKWVPEEHGTVGAVARDSYGNLCAGTSSGGIARKLPGRVGDSAIIGASTYADNSAGAVSTTGIGEAFQRTCTAFFVVERMRQGVSLLEALQEGLRRVESVEGQGGLIAISASGEWGWHYNTPHMARGVVTASGIWQVEI